MKKYIIYIGLPIILIWLAVLVLSDSSSDETVIIIPDTSTENPFPDLVVTNPQISDSAEKATSDCFSWYVNGFLAGKTYIDVLEEPKLYTCFTTEYISKFREIADVEGSDPVLLVQAGGDSWLQTQEIVILEQADATTILRVTIGEASEEVQYLVKMVKTEHSGWLISSVENLDLI